jgi:hypothetical protein
MNDIEIELFKKHLSCSKSYFEYGCGGSTVLADSYENITLAVSVDSSLDWINKVKAEIKSNKVEFFHIDINAEDQNWGVPKDKSKIDNWVLYPKSILQKDGIFDLILVDGRFRLACCAAAAIKMSNDSILLLHDCDRYKYVPLTKVHQEQSLGVYIKDKCSNEDLLSFVEKNKHNYS